MKTDLDRLMRERGLDALWITGPANHNPALVYFTGVANITRADLVKRCGEPPILFHYPMEREEAARTGLKCRNLDEFKLEEILNEAGGNPVKAGAIRTARIFRDTGVRGRVAVGGNVELSSAYALLAELPRHAPDVKLVGEGENPVLLHARSTKSREEIDRIRSIGSVATAVIGETAEFLSAHSARENFLAGRDGRRLTVGDVKAFIRRSLAGHGAEAPEGIIFAQGRDGAIPHSTGTDTEPLRTGRPIVFDLFPCETGGGYFYDITRTWCLGHAPEDVQQMHRQVQQVYAETEKKVRAGMPAREIQPSVCRMFESMGHPTIRSEPQTERGYVHSIGHGLGLNVHESPSFLAMDSNRDLLQPGAVFTIEPGLYYPDRGMGVRLENTVWIRPDGAVEVLADFPMDLVIPLRGGVKRKTSAPGRKSSRASASRIRAGSRTRKKAS
jgi:Xaa-Pro aminopeptidase